MNTSNPSGYSGTPLAKKLGIKQAHRILAIGAPDDNAAWLALRGDRRVVRPQACFAQGASLRMRG